MKKPTVFFSHSSKDSAMILAIKNKLDSITGGTRDFSVERWSKYSFRS